MSLIIIYDWSIIIFYFLKYILYLSILEMFII